ncbi:hypothetical protein BU23DRAFT_571928 [Bimuria novae-zelandiae CBS 107.79]|uniref:Uncharacterized protein n=1 Tax=Bimuria novae-zelandiae CBS 107.79 TaxID=1447943 RepID=A0A6A5UWD4_9PLEO|nr:hypothetical protein BU23DRAFT_571928 [Bimuria novae-zelandiae CBS 107.79]
MYFPRANITLSKTTKPTAIIRQKILQNTASRITVIIDGPKMYIGEYFEGEKEKMDELREKTFKKQADISSLTHSEQRDASFGDTNNSHEARRYRHSREDSDVSGYYESRPQQRHPDESRDYAQTEGHDHSRVHYQTAQPRRLYTLAEIEETAGRTREYIDDAISQGIIPPTDTVRPDAAYGAGAYEQNAHRYGNMGAQYSRYSSQRYHPETHDRRRTDHRPNNPRESVVEEFDDEENVAEDQRRPLALPAPIEKQDSDQTAGRALILASDQSRNQELKKLIIECNKNLNLNNTDKFFTDCGGYAGAWSNHDERSKPTLKIYDREHRIDLVKNMEKLKREL